MRDSVSEEVDSIPEGDVQQCLPASLRVHTQCIPHPHPPHIDIHFIKKKKKRKQGLHHVHDSTRYGLLLRKEGSGSLQQH